MPKLNHPTFGDVQSYKFIEGIVAEVHSDTDTADVIIPGHGTIPGVPIHYHCDGDVDSVQGGSAAFSAEDSVIVRVKIGSLSPNDMRVLGFTDGPKECGKFVSVRMWRGDGFEIKDFFSGEDDCREKGELLLSLVLFRADGGPNSSNIAYNEETGYWEVAPTEGYEDQNGEYYLYMYCYNGPPNAVYYPHLLDPEEEQQPSNRELVKFGKKYVEIIPFCMDSTVWDPTQTMCALWYGAYNQSSKGTYRIGASEYHKVRRYLPARTSENLENDCKGEEWTLVGGNISKGPISLSDTWPAEYDWTEMIPPTVKLPTAIAEEIAIEISETEEPDWEAFNARFPGILIGDDGPDYVLNPSSRPEYYNYFNKGAKNTKIIRTAWGSFSSRFYRTNQ